jgi:hypothetical protein
VRAGAGVRLAVLATAIDLFAVDFDSLSMLPINIKPVFAIT